MSNTLFNTNLALLKHHHPQITVDVHQHSGWSFNTHNSLPSLTGGGQTWKIQEPFLPPTETPWGYIVYGLGTGEYLRALLAQKASHVPVLVIDSAPDLVATCFQYFDFEAILAHPDLSYFLGNPTDLPPPLHSYLSQKRDLLQVQWLANPWVAQIATARQDPFYLQVFQQYQAYLAQAPTTAQTALQQLYQKMAGPMQAAYASHPLSCHSGCADCCKLGNGFDLCIRPVEWALMFESISQILPTQAQEALLSDTVLYLAKHADTLEKALLFFDQHLDQLQTERGNKAFYQLTQPLRKDPCPFLSEADTCGIYANRPLSCRTFGNSYFEPQQPYTCSKDRQLMERILLDEKTSHHLLEGHKPLSELQSIHSYYPYGHVIYAWLFTHLDLEKENWIPAARLDYHQFKRLVDDPGLFESQRQALQNWAQKLAKQGARGLK